MLNTTRSSDSETVDDVRARRCREVALGYRLFAVFGWGDLGDGHISARDPERDDCFWLLRLGVSFHDATVSDLVLVGPDGAVVQGNGPINESAYYIHQPIHDARPEITSAAHVHTDWGTPFAAEVRPLEPITQESCIFFENHALFDDEEIQVQDTDGGSRIAASLGSNDAVILRNHGLLTVGESVAEAVGFFMLMEKAAEAHMKVRDAKPIAPDSARYTKQDLLRIDSAKIGFHEMVRRHIGGPSIVE